MSKKEQIIISTARLFQQQGINAVGIKEILAASHVPKGSLYYYFPDGKRQIIKAAIKAMGDDMCTNIEKQLSSSPDFETSFHHLITGMIDSLDETAHAGTWSLSLMVMETAQDETLNALCQQIVLNMSYLYAQKLKTIPLPDETANLLGLLFQSNLEGALVTCAALHDTKPLKMTEKQLIKIVKGVIDEA